MHLLLDVVRLFAILHMDFHKPCSVCACIGTFCEVSMCIICMPGCLIHSQFRNVNMLNVLFLVLSLDMHY